MCFRCGLPMLCLIIMCVSCGRGGQPAGSGDSAGARFKPIDAASAVFWDRQTTETGELIRDLAKEFNASSQKLLPLKIEHTGGYADIFRKVSASIQAGALPAMAVAYQNMAAEYARAGAIIPLDDLINDPEIGIAQEDMDDFFPVIFETNRYPDLDNKMYSFPFCKSVMMLYYNKRVLAEAGLAEPPKTWTEFLDQARQIKAKTGKPAYAVSVDCSTIDGMIFSMGGEVAAGRTTLFDSEASIRVFELIETLAKEGLAYQITPGTYDDEVALSQDKVAFAIRSSSHRLNAKIMMEGDRDKWGMCMIPQSDPANPHTVLYGPSICIFNTTPEQQRSAWAFVKYFTSPEVTVRWALGTGYLPIRKSSAAHPEIQKFWAEWPHNRAPFDCLPYAKTEPYLAGWQEVRNLVEAAETGVLTGVKTGRQAAIELKKQADAALARE